MNIQELIRNAKISLCVVTGVAVIFGCAFVATTLVATAAEEEQAGATAPADKQSVESLIEPLPNAERQAPQPRRPAFADIDRDGDGAISEDEFRAFQSYAQPTPIGDAPRSRDGWGDRRPRREARPPRPERFEDRGFDRAPPDDRFRPRDEHFRPPPGQRDDRFRPRDEHFRPPPGPRGGQFGDRFDPSNRPSGPPPFAGGGRPGGRGRGDFERDGEGQYDHPPGRGGRNFGPPPRRPDDGFGPDGYRRPPRRPGY